MPASTESVEENREWEAEPIVYVNGVRRVLPDGSAHLTLLQYLRDTGLTGTKLGCGEGGCGACTVMVSFHDQHLKKSRHYAVNACLSPLYSVEGMHIITVEGLGNRQQGLHPVQESLANAHGSQCGYCTPGFIMSMYALLRSSRLRPSEEEIEESLAGNLCRCTGYRPIIDAFRVFAKSYDSLYTESLPKTSGSNAFVCPSSGKPCSCGEIGSNNCEGSFSPISGNTKQYFSHNEIDGSLYSVKELIFPSELLLRKVMPLKLDGVGGIKWYRPIDLHHLLNLKLRYPDAKLVVGNTEVGIEMKLKNAQYKVLIAATHVPELNALKINNEGLEIGASVRLTELQQFLKLAISERKAHETSACKALLEQLKWFAGKQIKNVASVGGNICTASPISDLNPLWMASGATFQIINCEGTIRTVVSKNFFLGYRKVNLGKSEILLSVFLPWTRSFEFVKEFKQAHRRDDDIALVNSGMRVFLKENVDDYSVIDASIVFGGVGPVSLAASQTEAFLIGKVWNKKLLDDALHLLTNEISINADAPGGMIEFRKSLTLSFFFKFYLCVSDMIKESGSHRDNGLPMKYQSAIMPYYRPPSCGYQSYESIKNGTAIGFPSVHLSAKLQVTGEAEYADDVPMPPNALHAALVLSTKAHARIISVDDSSAKASQGYNGLFLSKDIPGCNRVGAILKDEDVFASEFVTCVGQVIGIVVADTHENARLAANKVHIEYDELPAVLSIRSAIQLGSYYPNSERCLVKGNVDLCFQSGACEKIIEGEVQVGGQEHFYLETNSTLVWTVDGGNEVHMISSTQNPRHHQECIAKVLNLPLSKVVCKTKRIGGGFGGKETRSVIIAAAACVPSYLLKRPVKITLDRDTDMMITGQRHSFLGKYKVGFTNSGMLMALDLQLFNNAGNSSDLSFSVLERAMFHSENVYDIPNIRVLGNVCCTNFPSNTAFRGFGGPQGMLIAENWIQRVAMELHRSPEEIREINLQSEGYETHYGQQLENCTLIKIWNELKESCQYLKAREAVNIFNTQNRWKKRGISMIPTKFGISFTAKHMNQAGALVHVYLDGTILVTHGGVEMGQGLHTKVAQVAASAFKIPLSSVFISETSTDKVPNASPTAASASSDIYGSAVLNACEKIKSRMEPIASQKEYASFSELVQACYMERIDLSAHGFYITPDIGFDFKVGKGMPFSYFTYGAAFAEVEIDTLTGDFHTRIADIVMDLGHSINPAIDIGQIEGAFVQGMGWVTLEEIKWGDAEHNWIKPGHLYTCGPGNYKLPSVNDIPLKFKVSLLKGVPNPRAIHSSKAVGEPPFFLSSAVLFAIKDAIIAARAEEGYKEWFPLDNPATPERIRMACVDDFTKPFASADYHPKLSI